MGLLQTLPLWRNRAIFLPQLSGECSSEKTKGVRRKKRRRKEKGGRREILKERKGKILQGSIERKTRKEETKSAREISSCPIQNPSFKEKK